MEALNSILGTFLGALLGVPAGLAVNHAWTQRVDEKRTLQLRAVIKEAIDHNTYLMQEIERWIKQAGGIPFFNVDLTLLESTASLKYEVLDDLDLCKSIDALRFELTHLGRKVDLLLELEFSPAAKMAIDHPKGTHYNIYRVPLCEAISKHIESIRSKIEELQIRLA